MRKTTHFLARRDCHQTQRIRTLFATYNPALRFTGSSGSKILTMIKKNFYCYVSIQKVWLAENSHSSGKLMVFYSTKTTRNTGLRRCVAVCLIGLLLSLSTGGTALHFCLDGLEPPVTVHFENLNGHVDHDPDGGHNDFERQAFSDNILPKIFDVDLAKFIVTFLILPIPSGQVPQPLVDVSLDKPISPAAFLPPLRAPPLSLV